MIVVAEVFSNDCWCPFGITSIKAILGDDCCCYVGVLSIKTFSTSGVMHVMCPFGVGVMHVSALFG